MHIYECPPFRVKGLLWRPKSGPLMSMSDQAILVH